MKVKAILIDLFGTLINGGSDERVHQLISYELAKIHGFAYKPEEHMAIYENLVSEGMGSGEAVWEALKRLSRVKGFRLAVSWDEVREMHVTYHARAASLYGDALEGLRLSRRFFNKVGLVSDSDVDVAEAILEATSIKEFFDAVVVSGELGVRKPDPRLFLEGAARLSAEPGSCVMIGDTWKDVVGANEAGMKAVLLIRGALPSDIRADATAHTLPEAVEKASELLMRKSKD